MTDDGFSFGLFIATTASNVFSPLYASVWEFYFISKSHLPHFWFFTILYTILQSSPLSTCHVTVYVMWPVIAKKKKVLALQYCRMCLFSNCSKFHLMRVWKLFSKSVRRKPFSLHLKTFLVHFSCSLKDTWNKLCPLSIPWPLLSDGEAFYHAFNSAPLLSSEPARGGRIFFTPLLSFLYHMGQIKGAAGLNHHAVTNTGCTSVGGVSPDWETFWSPVNLLRVTPPLILDV